MAVTAIGEVSVDRTEYSRYWRWGQEGDQGVIRVTATGIVRDNPNDPLVFQIIAVNTGRVVAERSLTTAGSEVTTGFDLETDCKDADGIYRAIHGRYYARVGPPSPDPLTPVGGVESRDFPVRLVAVSELKSKYLAGISLRDERRLVAGDTRIPGVTIVVAEGIQEGGYTLDYTPSPPNLVLHSTRGDLGGPPMLLVQGRDDLWNTEMDGYLTVQVDLAALPTTARTGFALLKPATLDDETIGGHVDAAVETWQALVGLSCPLEPWTVGTEASAAAVAKTNVGKWPRDQVVFDRVGVAPEPWDSPKVTSRGPVIQLPGRRVLKLHHLGGYYNQTNVLEFDTLTWLVVDQYNGNLSLVPSAGSIYPAALGLMRSWGTSLATAPWGVVSDHVDNFWHYSYTHGLGDLWRGHGAVVREGIARQASMMTLLLAGRAAQGVYASESVNRDGVSLSRQYTGGQMGVYSAEIGAHDAWIKDRASRVRKGLIGIQVQW